MKASQYNYIFHKGESSYWMNGLTRSCLKFSKTLGKKVENLLQAPDKINTNSPKLYEVLIEGGFIIPDDTDEIEEIRELYHHSIEKKDYFLIIMPTLDCNFKCPYCVQSHIPSRMESETIRKVQDHIKYMIEEEGITSLLIEWFGGEPFLYFDEVIVPITKYAKELAAKSGIPFHAAATSNASLIIPEIAKRLSELSFHHFQITLDGDRKLHDTIKYNDEIESAFDTTLKNISNIIALNPSIRISLRINYMDETLRSNLVEEISERLPQDARNNISVILKKVWQHNPDQARFCNYLKVLNSFRNAGFHVNWLDIISGFMPCYVNKKYYACINYNGGIVKCTNSDILYSSHAPGKIVNNGKVVWTDNFDVKNQDPDFENPNCLKCKRLPICMGHCPRNHMEMQSWSCKWSALDIDLEKAVIAYIDDSYEKDKT